MPCERIAAFVHTVLTQKSTLNFAAFSPIQKKNLLLCPCVVALIPHSRLIITCSHRPSLAERVRWFSTTKTFKSSKTNTTRQYVIQVGDSVQHSVARKTLAVGCASIPGSSIEYDAVYTRVHDIERRQNRTGHSRKVERGCPIDSRNPVHLDVHNMEQTNRRWGEGRKKVVIRKEGVPGVQQGCLSHRAVWEQCGLRPGPILALTTCFVYGVSLIPAHA